MRDRVVNVVLAIDGIFGNIGTIKGVPDLKELDVEEDILINPRIEIKSRIDAGKKELSSKLTFRYKKVPRIELQNYQSIFKPIYIIKDKKTSKDFVIEADTGYLNYTLDQKVAQFWRGETNGW